jgi:hypothetical protein
MKSKTKHNYTLKKFPIGMHYIMLEEDTVMALTKDGNKRALCLINGQVEFHCAILSKKEGGHYIRIGSSICKELNIHEGSIVTATFKVDTSKYQFEMAEELQAVLHSDPEADIIFHSLTEGNQRGLIHLVTLVKSPDKRIERALKIVESIKNGITSPKRILK